jgi:hypothetical protein
MLVGLEYDGGVLFVSRNSIGVSSIIEVAKKCNRGRPPKVNTPTSIFQGVEDGMCWIGRVQMMWTNLVQNGNCAGNMLASNKDKKLHFKRESPCQPLNK